MTRAIILGFVAGWALAAATGPSAIAEEPARLMEQECGACHLAYPPQLLPARSWRALMDRLPEHFGENAGLDPGMAKEIGAYLAAKAADAGGRDSRVLWDLGPGEAPLRITETPFWLHAHNLIPAADFRLAKSKTNCLACHATLGGYAD